MFLSRIRQMFSSKRSTKTVGSKLSVVTLEDRAVPADLVGTFMSINNNSISENTYGGALFGNLTPNLPGGQGYTSFALVAGAGNTNNADFYVAGNQLRTSHNLNFEQLGSPLSVRIRATAANGVSGEDTFTLGLTNVNERPTGLTLSNTSVPENSAGSTVIGSLNTVDPDAGDAFNYSLINNAGGRFQISGNQLVVAPNANLNFEQQRSFYVAIKTTDIGGLSTTRGFHIQITNVLEAPTNLALSNQSIVENSPKGQYVGTLSATNPEGGAITYTLLDDAGGRFGISGSNLVVNNGSFLDFENLTSHQVNVQASGTGGVTTQLFTIQVTNANESPTDLTLSSSQVTLPATTVGTLSAVDPDAGNTFQYILTNNANGKFQIVGNQLQTADQHLFVIDPAPSYQVTVLVLDQSGGSFSKTFTINVSGIPTGNNSTNTAPTAITISNSSINENSLNGSYVGTLSTVDDAPTPAALTLLDDAGGRFAINGVNLVVANGSSLNFEANSSHTVKVRATDAGGLTFDQVFTINVNNLNESPTSISLSNSNLSLPTTPGFVVGNLSATDPDAGSNLTFFLAENAGGKFQIVGNQLVVTDPNQFVWNPQPTYQVHVYVQDQAGGIFDQWFTLNVTGT